MTKLVLALTISLTAGSMAHASTAKCDSLKGALAARLSDACESATPLTQKQLDEFKAGIEGLLSPCQENDFADALYQAVISKKLGLADACKARAKVLSHATGLTEA